MPPRGNQPQERVCAANWRRSLCAAKRDPRLGGCTPPRPPIRKSEGAGAKRTQYYCPFLTPPPLPPPLNSGVPPNPRRGKRPPCQRGLAALADWGIPTGCALQPVPGQPPPTAKGRAAALPCPSRPQPVHATSPLPPPFVFCPVGRGLDPSATSRSTPANGSPVGEGFIPPAYLPPPPTSAGRRGRRPLPRRSVRLLIAANLPGGLGSGRPTSHFTIFRRGRACPARSLAIATPLSFAS